MANTASYPIIVPKITDLIIGSQTYTEADPVLDNPTRNFTVGSLVNLIPAVVPGGGTVTSVGTVFTGDAYSAVVASPTTQPVITISPQGTALQYINGLGNLITFPSAGGLTLTTNNTSGNATLGASVLNIPNYTAPIQSITTVGTTGAATLDAAGVLNIPNYANTEYTLTTNGTSGDAATLVGTVINIPTPVTPAVNFTSLATVGTSGAATLISGVLNIPNYATGAGGSFLPLAGGQMTGAITSATAANLILTPGTSIVEVKGDGVSVDAGIKLNCYTNAHGQTLKSQPHSENITNTMLMPKGVNSTLVSEATETGVITVSSATGTSTGSPLGAAIVGRALNLTANIYNGTSNLGFVPAGGSATTFLRGDGFWATPAGGGGSGTVTSVAALTLGTAGTDLASTVANGATTPVITLNVPTASAVNRGALSSTDWTTFNNKTSTTGTVTTVSSTIAGTAFSSNVTNASTTPAIAITTNGTTADYINGAGDYIAISTLPSGTGTVTNVGVTTDIAAFTAAVTNPTASAAVTLNLNGGSVGQFLRQDGTWATVASGGSGTVTSITAGTGLSGGTITTSGTIAVDSTVVRTSGVQTIAGVKTFSDAVSGSSTITATNFILSSDRKLKENIKELKPDTIKAEWRSFTMKCSEEGYRTGVIAQELEVNHPEFVETDSKGYKSVKYIDLLISKIHELENRIKTLEK